MSINYWEDEAVLEDEESALHDDAISDDDEFAETLVLDQEAPAEDAYKSGSYYDQKERSKRQSDRSAFRVRGRSPHAHHRWRKNHSQYPIDKT